MNNSKFFFKIYLSFFLTSMITKHFSFFCSSYSLSLFFFWNFFPKPDNFIEFLGECFTLRWCDSLVTDKWYHTLHPIVSAFFWPLSGYRCQSVSSSQDHTVCGWIIQLAEVHCTEEVVLCGMILNIHVGGSQEWAYIWLVCEEFYMENWVHWQHTGWFIPMLV